MPLLKKYPALTLQAIAGLVTSVLTVWASANVTGSTNWWLLLSGLIPLASGALTHAGVVPVETIKDAVRVADTWTDVGKDLARSVNVAISDRPPTRI